jgi:hypothetical protein
MFATAKSPVGLALGSRPVCRCFDEFRVRVPSSTIQRLFQEAVAPCFSQIQALEQQNQALRKTRDILLPGLMNGTIAV